MTLDPNNNAGSETRRNPAVQSRFAASPAQVPGCVSTHDAAGHGDRGKEPGISLVGDEQEQQQVSTAGDGQWDDGGIDNGNQEESQRPKLQDPVRHQEVMHARDRNGRRQGRERAHEELDVLRERQAARQDSTIPCGWRGGFQL